MLEPELKLIKEGLLIQESDVGEFPVPLRAIYPLASMRFAGSMKSTIMLSGGPWALCESGAHEFAASRDVSLDPPCDPQTMTLRCLIIDDSRCFLAAARSLLERQGMMIVGDGLPPRRRCSRSRNSVLTSSCSTST